MIYIILLTAAGILYTLYSKWRDKRNLLADIALGEEQAKVDALKSAIKQTEKELDETANKYSTIYDAYKRKYHTSKRDDPK